MTEDDWSEVINVNLNGTFYAPQQNPFSAAL